MIHTSMIIARCNQVGKFNVQPCSMIERHMHMFPHLAAPAVRGSIKITYIPYVEYSS